jgi:hypothetical protein
MTQLETIKQQLHDHGEVSRNWALQRYISRLGSRILELRQAGYKFEIERRGGDYVYILKEKPEPFIKKTEPKQPALLQLTRRI